ncbi:hypothetical protein [Paenibacillus macquariensis]|uniref:ABC-2 family transporter protein n=1 Tax=Paenibacillus macquariensis TaxID=948756 RepID=A0ABY1JWT1_9BACL|nr:hypothetical protein [Paenibacillus macquariensis]MEC0089419.1 hypothetical protein [Paenibacillus macquariensis]OAB33194.1 hypothetical protein PMSM_14345 [Paenibacillus macquariensis subsp. macquariensis]SIQ91690.1 hypothetical protein SAMN05421578_10538 [Paenibacillus macquariensis]
MMKLLKYDFKRNGAKLLGVAVVLILAQLSIMLLINNITLITVFSMLAYMIAGVILFITPIRTYSYNLKAYHRKLLPVHSLKTIISPIAMGFICLLILGLIMLIHGYVYLTVYENTRIFDIIKMYPMDTIMSLLSACWIMINMLITIFLAITIATSIRSKGSFWIGIVVFFIIVNGLSWIENLFFGESQWGIFQIFSDESNSAVDGIVTNVNYNPSSLTGGMIGSFIFELVCSVAFLYIMVKLIDRKVEA